MIPVFISFLTQPHFLNSAMTSSNNFQMLNDQLLNLGSVNSISELQGVLCGKLSGGKVFTADEWTEEALKFLDLDYLELSDEQKKLFSDLLLATQDNFVKDDYSFYPLLPDEGATLLRRTEELASWCEGFLHGVGTSGLQGNAEMSSEAAEGLRDIAQISQVDLRDETLGFEEGENEGEAAWTELLEYVRTLAMTLHTELSLPETLRKQAEKQKPNETLH